MIDKTYAMSSFLQFRTVYDPNIKFAKNLDYPRRDAPTYKDERTQIDTWGELHDYLKNVIESVTADGKAALALSGGIDSAICAKFMPEGSTAYTFKCVVSDGDTIDETQKAEQCCSINRLKHCVVEINWDDYETYAPIIMRHKNAPIHSIEVQIYKAAMQAKQDGFSRLVFGASADIVFGGMDGLLSKDYLIGQYIDRFSFVLPYRVLKEFDLITAPFEKWTNNGIVDSHGFINDVYSSELANSYHNACTAANIDVVDAYLPLRHIPIDIQRIRNGDSKYIVRELYRSLYPDYEIPEKIPMPRPMEEWLNNWEGPKRPEFWPNCHKNMTGDQKYYIWILEKFLELFS